MGAPRHFALFDTAIGPCAVAWDGGGARLVGLELPEASAAATRARLLRHVGAAEPAPPPPAVRTAIEGIQALLRGEPRDLLDIELDMTGVPDFHRRVYAVARRIPPGATRTYGELAAELGDARLARAVGQALGRNPFAPVVPCHRILAAHGRPGGFSAGGGALTKLRMLAIEGAAPGGTASLFDGSVP